MADQNHLDPSHLFEHVQDADYFHVPRMFAPEGSHGHLEIPQPFGDMEPIFQLNSGPAILRQIIEPFDLRLTKFMVLEVVAAVICCIVFIYLANRMRSDVRPRGRMWNLLESMLLFIRDDVARPAIGKHDADRFLPLLWSLFFFVLGCNLLGMVPWLGSPTGALATTGALALVTFAVVIGSGSKQLGVVGFWKAQVPHMDLDVNVFGLDFGPVLRCTLIPMIFAIELMGLCIKHFVLAVRLLANMMAGHIVLAVIVAFIAVTWGSLTWWGVMPASLFGATALSLLELFVAFLQAYIFTFLSALFIGAAVHPH